MRDKVKNRRKKEHMRYAINNKRKKEIMRDKSKNKGMRRFEEIRGDKLDNSTKTEYRGLQGRKRQHYHHRDCNRLFHNRKAGDKRGQGFEVGQRLHGREYSRRLHEVRRQDTRSYHSIEQEKHRIIRRIRHLKRRLRKVKYYHYGRFDREHRGRVGHPKRGQAF